MIEINKIYNDDCMNILKQLPDKSIDLCITDPPYEIDLNGGISKSGLGQRAKKLKQDIRFVSKGFDYAAVFNELLRVCKKVNLYIFCSNKQISKTMSFFEDKGYITTLLVWNKTNAIPLANFTYHSNAEFIVCVREKASCFNKLELYKKSKIISMPYPIVDRIHPTQKPVELIKRLLEIKSNENDLVLDCFSGSGTTAVACHKMKRNFICVEKDKTYYELSCKRLEQEQKQLELF